jgi:hypothetical protein
MNVVRAVVMIVVCAGAIAWIGNGLVSQSGQAMSGRGERTMAFDHDESHHRRHHGSGVDRGMNELFGSTLLFSGVAAAVIVPSVLIQRKKRMH